MNSQESFPKDGTALAVYCSNEINAIAKNNKGERNTD
jgi:hypothetical protein